MKKGDNVRKKGNAHVCHTKEFENWMNAVTGDEASNQFVRELLSYRLQKRLAYNMEKNCHRFFHKFPFKNTMS